MVLGVVKKENFNLGAADDSFCINFRRVEGWDANGNARTAT